MQAENREAGLRSGSTSDRTTRRAPRWRRSRLAQSIEDAADEDGPELSSDIQVDLRTLEALLFSTHHPLTAGRLAELLELESTKPISARSASSTNNTITTDRCFRVEQVAGGYQLLTLPDFGDILKRLHQKRRRHQAHQGRAGDAGDHRLQAADPPRRHRSDPRRGVRRNDPQPDGKTPGQNRRPRRNPRPADPLRHDQALPRTVRPEQRQGPAARRIKAAGAVVT